MRIPKQGVPRRLASKERRRAESGGIGYILLWLLGVPLPVLAVIFLLRGCN